MTTLRAILPKRFTITLLAALFLTFSYAPSPLWFLAYFFIPLFIAANRGLTFREAFKNGYWFGFIISITLLYWVAVVTVAGFILLIFAHSLYYALAAGMLALTTRRYGNGGLLLFPFVWVAVEYIRSLSQVSFPWLNLSYTQWENLAIVQLSELSGDAVVSFFIVCVGILLYLGYTQARRPARAATFFAVAILLYAGAYFWGALRIVPTPVEIKVAVLQGNVPNEQKWRSGRIDHNFDIYEELTRQAKSDSAQLVIWPETAAPCYLEQEASYLAWVESIAARYDLDLLVGALHLTKDESAENHYCNSAYFFRPEGMLASPYDKVKLVPFSEHIPYEERIGWLADLRRFVRSKLDLDISDFEPGDSLLLFSTRGTKFSTLICFEVVYPQFVRQMVNSGAEFLAVITNDAWFGETAGPYQHAAIPIFRAVENRCWIVRAANTGISEVIDPMGRVVARTRLGERAQLTRSIGGRTGETLFSHHGLVLSPICLAVTGLVLLICLFGKGKDD
ncbi:MAG: apolipoprotein N-acyltransferase [candidate division Zixibacteria bacterium]|nr:apolipoprotein N-acyltransferase [candidate division Zixibacteria bacterium]